VWHICSKVPFNVHPLLLKNDISLTDLPGMQYIPVTVTGN